MVRQALGGREVVGGGFGLWSHSSVISCSGSRAALLSAAVEVPRAPRRTHPGTCPQAAEVGGLSAQWRTGGTSQRRLSPRKTPAYRDPAISHFLHSGTASAVAGPRLLPSPRPSPSPGPAVRSRRQRRFARWIGFLGGRRLPGSPPSAVTHTHNRAAHHTPHTTPPPPPSQRERPQASEIFNYLVYPRGTVINPRLRPSLLHTQHDTSTQRARAATLRADNSTLDTIPTRPPSRRSGTASFLPR